MLKVTILCDNSTIIDSYLYGEPGFSAWIECGGRCILFDTGYSDIFLKNAQLLGLDLSQLDYLVYSHGHNDHTWGTHALITYMDRKGMNTKPVLVAHPQTFAEKRSSTHYIGTLLAEEALSRFFTLNCAAAPCELLPALWWLGEIEPSVTPRGSVGRVKTENGWEPDFCYDDSALAAVTAEGLVIITGCSHSGICNVIEQARRVTGVEKVADIIGGFHLLESSKDELAVIEDYFRSVNISKLHPCHCTDTAAKAFLSQSFKVCETGAGLTLEYQGAPGL